MCRKQSKHLRVGSVWVHMYIKLPSACRCTLGKRWDALFANRAVIHALRMQVWGRWDASLANRAAVRRVSDDRPGQVELFPFPSLME